MKKNNRVRLYFTPLFLLVIALEILCFIADLNLPAGYAEWVLYFFPLLLIWNTTPLKILSVITLVSALNVVSFIFAQDSNVPPLTSFLNRLSGLIIFWIISMIFISRIKSQEARVKSERQYKELIETANSIMIRWSPSGTILFVNPYGQRFLGYTAEELLGKNVMILVPGKESTGRDLSTLTQEIVQHPERFTSFINENVCKDGTVAWVSWTNNAITDEYGQLVEILAIGNDITGLKRVEQELRKSEERLRLATEGAQLGIFDWDIQRDMPLWDRRMYEIFGMSPAEKPINKELFVNEVLHPEDLQRFNMEIADGMNQGTTFNGSYRIRRRNDGQVRWIQYFGKFNLSPQGTPVRLVSTLADITERKEAEQELKKSEERLRLLNDNLENLVIKRTEEVHALSKALTLAEQRERKQFSRILHEDIQQKLFGARMLFKQYLRDQQAKGQPPQQEDLEDGVDVLEQALKTTKALSIELNPPVLNTEGLDAALKWLVTHMYNTYGLSVDLQMHGKVVSVRNETQLMLTQMVREVLNNVKQHSGVMDAMLIVECEREHLMVIVKDSGRGFDPAIIFPKKVDENRLGLLSIKERLKLFGGDLTIQSGPGKGTIVTIFLPYQNC